MSFAGLKIGFALIPQKETIEEIQSFLEGLKKSFPDAKILLSTLQVNPEYSDPKHLANLLANPYITFATLCKIKQDLVARAYNFLDPARTLELDYLIFNTGVLRYDLDTTKHFVSLCQELPFPDIIFGEPPILNPGKLTFNEKGRKVHEAQVEALKIQKVRQRLVIDTLINSILTKPNEDYRNINAGLFCLKTTKDVLRRLTSVQRYEDSSLVCSQMAWHLGRLGFTEDSVPVNDIKLDTLGFNLEKAVNEVQFVIDMVCSSSGCGVAVLAEKVGDLFHKQTFYNRWISSADEEWFYEVVVPRLRKLGCRI